MQILAVMPPLWHLSRADERDLPPARLFNRCGSSVVEHSLGKGEVESSILSRSTIPVDPPLPADSNRRRLAPHHPMTYLKALWDILV